VVKAGDRKETVMLLGSRPSAMIRLRGWERVAFGAAIVGAAITGRIGIATWLGLQVAHAVSTAAETLAGALVAGAFVAVVMAVRRYEGESVQLPPSRVRRLAARLTSRR
jgi:hypothetical protein